MVLSVCIMYQGLSEFPPSSHYLYSILEMKADLQS